MAGRVGILSAKCRPKSVDLAHRAGKTLDLQLATDRQVSWLAKEILGVIDLALRSWQFFKVERCRPKHRAGAFTIAGRNDWRMNVEKSLLLEEVVNRPAGAIPDAGDRPEGVGSRPEMRDGSQKFERMSFFLKRIFLRIGRAMNDDSPGVHFGRLKDYSFSLFIPTIGDEVLLFFLFFLDLIYIKTCISA